MQFEEFPLEACFKEATTTSGRLFVLFAGVEVFLQCFDVGAEGFVACGGDAADGSRMLCLPLVVAVGYEGQQVDDQKAV